MFFEHERIGCLICRGFPSDADPAVTFPGGPLAVWDVHKHQMETQVGFDLSLQLECDCGQPVTLFSSAQYRVGSNKGYRPILLRAMPMFLLFFGAGDFSC